MSAPRVSVDPQLIYDALQRHAGNKTAMARELGLHRETVRNLMIEYGIGDKPVAGGALKPLKVNKLPLPAQGKISRYLLTSAQNNTYAFSSLLANLEAYSAHLTQDGNICQIMASKYTYNKAAYENSTLAKPGTRVASDEESLWYDPRLEKYFCDDPSQHGSCRYQLAPDLQWCADINVSPTADNPLSKLDSYAGNHSAIFPHAKVAMKSMPRMKGEQARFLYTTGTVTQMNYIQRKAGQVAQHHHVYGALIIEVNSDGDWWVRQLNADSKGRFYDISDGSVLHVADGKITSSHRVEAINWGDVHASEIDEEVKEVNWAKGGVIDALRPKYQMMHDLFSMRSRSHHDMKSFEKMYKKYLNGYDSVEEEVDQTYNLISYASRDFCQMVVVSSNHDRHGEKWLDEADYKADLPNAKFFLQAQLERVLAMEAGKTWMFLEWAVRRICETPVKFLGLDESFCVGPSHHRIECGLHGDLGPNGARGSTKNLRSLGLRTTKGHDHQATIDGPTWSAGVCQLDMDYAKGPSSWSVSHVVCYTNGKRVMLSQRSGKLWA